MKLPTPLRLPQVSSTLLVSYIWIRRPFISRSTVPKLSGARNYGTSWSK